MNGSTAKRECIEICETQRRADGRIRLKLLGEAGFSLVPPKEGGAAKILISQSCYTWIRSRLICRKRQQRRYPHYRRREQPVESALRQPALESGGGVGLGLSGMCARRRDRRCLLYVMIAACAIRASRVREFPRVTDRLMSCPQRPRSPRPCSTA